MLGDSKHTDKPRRMLQDKLSSNRVVVQPQRPSNDHCHKAKEDCSRNPEAQGLHNGLVAL